MLRIEADTTYPIRDLPPGTVADVTYENGAGMVTRRCIEVKHSYRSAGGTEYIRAYCRLRGEDRTFRRDRILRIHALQGPDPFPGPATLSDAGPGAGAPAGQARQPARTLQNTGVIVSVALLLVVLILVVRGPPVEPTPAASTQVCRAEDLPSTSVAADRKSVV